ncbi:hypothetical protein SASPL_103925 [Salvia splendens]|uniref:SAUR family protein n=1 Tax=Salvia splendens TaxID=180675 RepID=A0A8X8YIB0_SALSN|nr:auxin-responsive protein SAUR24-like [Salvia splendens]KAG6432349.1 hypothetical protein SASPL_103925 [Salvia splendens]
MGSIRGFSLKHRVATSFRRVFRWKRLAGRYRSVEPLSWTERVKTKAKAVLGRNMDPGGGYFRVGKEEWASEIPKGHMAIYVGEKDGDMERILVPIVYINHPLFRDLLKESEREFGYKHPGGLTIPCRISEFESVQTRIKAGQCTRKLLSWKKMWF